jgi:molybdate transport system regulatory protein
LFFGLAPATLAVFIERMSKQSNKPSSPAVHPRIRVVCGGDIALGPGKVDLLALVSETGSIREASERMNMSYMRAWTLIKTMNTCFKEPLVEAVRGGRRGGGARLTETGRKALALYQRMEESCLTATEDHWAAMKKLLRT